MAKLVELIYTRKRVWKWTMEDPIRLVYQLFTTDWELMVEHDPETMKDNAVGLERLWSD